MNPILATSLSQSLYVDFNITCIYRGSAQATTNAQQFGQGTGRIWLSNVQCQAGAQDFFDCQNNGFGNTGGCSHFNDAGVVCNYQATEGKLRKTNLIYICFFGGLPGMNS